MIGWNKLEPQGRIVAATFFPAVKYLHHSRQCTFQILNQSGTISPPFSVQHLHHCHQCTFHSEHLNWSGTISSPLSVQCLHNFAIYRVGKFQFGVEPYLHYSCLCTFSAHMKFGKSTLEWKRKFYALILRLVFPSVRLASQPLTLTSFHQRLREAIGYQIGCFFTHCVNGP